MKYLALFDWDKTVRKNYACTNWLEMIVESKKVSKDLLKENGEVYQKYLKGDIDHNELTEQGMAVYGKYIKDVKKEDLLPVLEKYKVQDEGNIFDIMKQDIFPFLEKNNIKIIVISGAQQELIELYKEELKIDEIYAVEYKLENGIYTDNYINNGLDENKQKIIDDLLKNSDNKILFAFGDSISDIPLLKAADKCFINNTKTKFNGLESEEYFDFSNKENGKIIVNEMEEILKKYGGRKYV